MHIEKKWECIRARWCCFEITSYFMSRCFAKERNGITQICIKIYITKFDSF